MTGIDSLIANVLELSSPGLLVLIVVLLIRGTLMLRSHHEDVVSAIEQRHTEVQGQQEQRHQEVQSQLQERLSAIEHERQWWKEASVATLRIGERLTEDRL